jgi:transposase-like zinc ribbon protein
LKKRLKPLFFKDIQELAMSADLQNPIFTEETAAREALEAVRWPNGPVCPHCGSVERVASVGGEKHRAGLYYCNADLGIL